MGVKNVVKLCSSLKEGLDLAKGHPDIETCWVIGGSSIYKESMNLPECHRIYLTQIDQEFKCDVFLPPIDETAFRQLSDDVSELTSAVQVEGDITYSFKVFEKMS